VSQTESLSTPLAQIATNGVHSKKYMALEKLAPYVEKDGVAVVISGLGSEPEIWPGKGGSPSASSRPEDHKRMNALLEQDPDASAVSKYRAVMASISLVDVVLAMLACWAMYSAFHLTGSRPDVFLGATTSLQVAVFCGYICLSTSHGFLQQRSGTTEYSFVAATIMIWIAKCVVSFAMFAGKNDLQTGLATLFAPGCSRFGNLPAFILPVIPGWLLACYDVLSFSSLTALDPATYQILLNSRILVVCLLWSVMFQRKLSNNQWLVFLLLFAACITRGLDRIQVMGASVSSGILTVIAQVSISAFASVLSEVLLKEMPMPTDLINFCTYIWGLVALIITLQIQHGSDALYSQWLSPASWSKLWGDPWMMASIVCLTAFGITTSYLIKELSNIVKELSRGFVIVACAALDWFLVGQSARTPAGIGGVILAILGICLYSIEPLRNQAVEAPRKDKS